MRKVKLQNSKVFALVDDEDYKRVSQHKWRLERRKNGQRYVRGTVNGKTERLHRFVLGLPRKSITIDHRDHDGIDNQKRNLRVASYGQNRANSIKRKLTEHSRFKGVKKHKSGKWEARIGIKRKDIYLGLYDREDQAAAAYDGAARILFGKYACFNL